MHNKYKLTLLILIASIHSAFAAELALSDDPLFLSNKAVPNIMILYGNSNSMDSQADGQAVGSASPDSKSEITREAVKTLITNYEGKVNMGLMAYAQSNISANDLSSSPYDISYNPDHYNPSWTGARNSKTNKKFRMVNPSDPTRYIYYNVALPSYGAVQTNKANNNLYCYNDNVRSKAFNNNEIIVNNDITNSGSGPWIQYKCFFSKKTTVNAGPIAAGADNPAITNNATTAGYTTPYANLTFHPTDSDLAQGITNFGNQISQSYVSPTWFSNRSPGYGYVHVPIALLNATQKTKLNTKLGTSQFATTNTQTNANYPLVNAGLTPLAGAVNTASSYFAGTLTAGNQGGSLPAPPNSCGQNFLLMLTDGLPSVLANGTISNNTTAMLSDLTQTVSNLKTARNVSSYVVGFALPFGVSISQLNDIAVAGGTNHPFYADDPATLNTALSDVFTDIISRTSAASSVALNSGYISTGDKVYQARFSSADWSGDLLSIPLSSTGGLPSDIITAATWRAGARVTAQTPNNRVIITTKSSTGAGIPFRWSGSLNPSSTELDLTQSLAFSYNPAGTLDLNGEQRLDYLRGSRTGEGTTYRLRSSVLGDIINSSPILVKSPQSPYLASDYITFKSTYSSRTPVIYVGANDGMLHGFNANTGNEVLAFVPNAVFSNLSKLTSKTYTHRYFVDGSPNYADVTYSDASWHTVLASGMGNGAKGIFALDVTNPTNFTEANAASIVNFEYTNSNDSDIGFIQGAPSIVKLNNGKWAAVFGNGWNNNGSGQSALFIVDIQTGALIKKIRTGSGNLTTPNGLANPTTVDVDGNGTVDYVYGGDLYGNMWKFNISDASPANWGMALSGSALYAAGTSKPITVQPDVSISPNGGYMVLFGTGRYLQNADLTTVTAQTFYGIWDNNAVVTSSQIKQQTITQSTTEFKSVSTGTVNYPTQKGWYINLPGSGERSVTDSLLSGGNIFFSTLTPSAVSCSYGGKSWLMAVNYLHGNQTTTPIFDANGDGTINADDTIYSGITLEGISSAPTILKGLGDTNKPLQELFFNLSTGNVTGVYTSGNKMTSRRTSWRPIIQR